MVRNVKYALFWCIKRLLHVAAKHNTLHNRITSISRWQLHAQALTASYECQTQRSQHSIAARLTTLSKIFFLRSRRNIISLHYIPQQKNGAEKIVPMLPFSSTFHLPSQPFSYSYLHPYYVLFVKCSSFPLLLFISVHTNCHEILYILYFVFMESSPSTCHIPLLSSSFSYILLTSLSNFSWLHRIPLYLLMTLSLQCPFMTWLFYLCRETK